MFRHIIRILFVLFAGTAVLNVLTLPASAQAIVIALNPKATYLRTNNDSGSLNAAAIRLSDLGLSPGRQVKLESLGDWRNASNRTDSLHGLTGIFSGSNILLSADQLHRVQDAISAGGTPAITEIAYQGSLPTDIPEDFLVSLNDNSVNGTVVTIPAGAKYLFVSAFDDLFGDNDDPNSNWKLQITPADAIVSGAVTLSGAINPAQAVSFTFRPINGGASFTRTVTLNADKTFSLTGILGNAYTVHIKGDKWLAQNVSVDAANGNVSGVTATLAGGDANNDNAVSLMDFGILVNAFGSQSGGSGYNDRADFTCDGKIDLADFGVLVNSFGSVGSP